MQLEAVHFIFYRTETTRNKAQQNWTVINAIDLLAALKGVKPVPNESSPARIITMKKGKK